MQLTCYDLRMKVHPPLWRSAIGAASAVSLLCASSVALGAEADAFTRALEKGPFFAAMFAFAGGLLTALTPCVYPMIAVTVSVFGARQARSRTEAVLLSTSFVLGIAVLYTVMLIAAALTGSVFGSVLANRWVNVGLALIFGALALSMFGAFEMVLPAPLMRRLASVGGIGYGGAFLLGLVLSLIAAPCTGPVLTGILLWIGKTRNVGLGAIVGIAFALGLGIPFWLVGAFAVSLPKSGRWMLWVKSVFGIVMVVMALYFLKNAVPELKRLALPTLGFRVGTALAVAVGLGLGAIHLTWEEGGLATKLRKVVGIASTSAGAFLFWVAIELPHEASAITSNMSAKPALVWGHSEPEATARARAEKKPLLVDFTAEWCGACKRLSAETLSDPRVTEKAAHFVAVKVDATNDEDPQIEAVKGKYKVVGLPTVVMFDSRGNERSRFNDFVTPEVFLAAIEGIR